MRQELRQSLPAKLTALGFIAMVLLGNYWIILAVFDQPYPQWLMSSFLLAALWLVACAVALFIKGFALQLGSDSDEA